MRRILLAAWMAAHLVPAGASAQAVERTGFQKFAIEAGGATAGSLLGFGAIYLAQSRCDVEDLGCNLQNVFGGMALGTIGAAGGAYATGRIFDTEPSLLGASVGAVAGAAAGIGMWHLFTEELDVINDRVPAMLTYAVTQGIVTALGSRLARSFKQQN